MDQKSTDSNIKSDNNNSQEINEISNKSIINNNNGDDNNKKKKPAKNEKKESIPVHKLFRFANRLDIVLILIGSICSIALGALIPVSIIMFGNFVKEILETLHDRSIIVERSLPTILDLVYVTIGIFVSAYISSCCWILTGENQTRNIRFKYLHSVLHQSMEWYDKAEDGSLTGRLSVDAQLLQDGISEKFGYFIMCIAQVVTGFVVALATDWKLALVIIASAPILVGSAIVMGHFTTKYTEKAQDSYSKAGYIAEQAFSGIKTVYAFSMQRNFLDQYDKHLLEARRFGYKRGFALGLTGVLFFSFFSIYGLAFWYGAKLAMKGELSAPKILIVLESIVNGSIGLMNIPPYVTAISNACGAAKTLFATIDRKSDIDATSDKGEKIEDSKLFGEIEFNNIDFHYPTRPNVKILKKVNLKIESGKRVALVGRSGAGKSSIVQILQRFYDPTSGEILLDGKNIQDLNLKWLRDNISCVSQEPVLFNLTIRQNILLGTTQNVSEDEILSVCKTANCLKFINELPNGFDTFVGDNGTQLSGGQKQRIAIARSLIRRPKILLLDEATSALDTQSERLVQKALDAAAANRTTIIVAHRLSTIRNADLIVVIDNGQLIEQGTHSELINLGGVYADLVKKQEINKVEDNSIDVSEVVEHPITTDEDLSDKEVNTLTSDTLQKMTTKDEDKKVSVVIDDGKEKHQLDNKSKKASYSTYSIALRILKEMRKEWLLIFIGYINVCLSGAPYPVFALLFSKATVSIAQPASSNPGPMEGSNLYAFLFAILGVGSLIFYCLKVALLEIAGETYTRRLRYNLFKAYLKQEVSFFDQKGNTTGAIISKLATDTKNVNEMITKAWPEIMRIFVTGSVGLIIAFVFSWQLSLVVLGIAPVLVFGVFFEVYIENEYNAVMQKSYAESSELAINAIKGVRTVASLNQQHYFEEEFFKATERPHLLNRRRAILAPAGYALTQCCIPLTDVIAFYAGMRFIANGWIDFEQMFTSWIMIMMTALGIGQSLTFSKTVVKARLSAEEIFTIIDRQPTIDPDLEGVEPKTINGDISYENITFRYPARPDIPIFNGEFNLYGKRNTSIALVGPSGCGKSTAISMLERFYDPLGGTVCVDETDINKFSLGNLRGHMALVSQEPILFDISIRENVLYGIEDPQNDSQDQIEEACKSANIHEFIKDLPDGYDTRVGDKGSQLSGGQKQRIAIARALIRKPKILLLDEATSALDSESEKLVQGAIDKIVQHGEHTIIIIAHRLSTIQNADLICVVNNGRIEEQGTHDELMKLNGLYAELVEQQSLTMV
ncbi:unnamed protein product [Cunninghamella echinulata]